MSAEKSPGKFTEVLCIFCNNRKMDIANIGRGGGGGVRCWSLTRFSRSKVTKRNFIQWAVCSSRRPLQQLAANQLCCPQAIHMMSQTRLSICTYVSSAKFFADYNHCRNSTVNGTWYCHPMEYQNRTFTLFVLIKFRHEAFVWCSVPWQWSGKTIHDE